MSGKIFIENGERAKKFLTPEEVEKKNAGLYTENWEFYARPVFVESSQSYDDHFCTPIRCKTCKTNQLMVGFGSYLTAVKCPNCGWEEQVHDG